MNEIVYLTVLAISIIIVVRWFRMLLFQRTVSKGPIDLLIEIYSVIILPTLFFIVDMDNGYECCGTSMAFAPKHIPTILTILVLSIVAYFTSRYRKSSYTAVAEVFISCFLVIGFFMAFLLAYQVGIGQQAERELEEIFVLFGCPPWIILFSNRIIRNNKFLNEEFQKSAPNSGNFIIRIFRKFYTLNPLFHYPLLILICSPVLAILASILLLFGQEPDSLIRAFTETYNHGFSQFSCEGVQCGGHYLCTIASKGHHGIVKPVRAGIRGGKTIQVNRQLLVANAFEELIQELHPRAHKMIRNTYDKVGDYIIFWQKSLSNPFICDLIYWLMKPLEWLFIIVLYTFDKQPENRISMQYLGKSERAQLDKLVG